MGNRIVTLTGQYIENSWMLLKQPLLITRWSAVRQYGWLF